ncbi:MAG TPA: HIT domain-containing protein [Candidatus Marinimicrobia bacterium]|jgi:ATP adenylyltransferase|nr:HIT domain-containing protein [Candidatus Neomarinimicrobiota bacterium]|tara:strand:+ start:5963 stop:6457 length:495 start_codon:yes stop_codon:yes gene_type:complete
MSHKKHLWAPWKMEYIKNKDASQKIFSSKPNETEDKGNFILYRGESCYIIMNYYPYNNGHLMIVPYEESDSVENLADETLTEIMRLTKKTMKILRENLQCHGFNFGANIGKGSGASIEGHLHFHIVPRWTSDTSFMPVVGSTKVVAQGLHDTYDQLKPFFEEIK